jgi:hypothetical protein
VHWDEYLYKKSTKYKNVCGGSDIVSVEAHARQFSDFACKHVLNMMLYKKKYGKLDISAFNFKHDMTKHVEAMRDWLTVHHILWKTEV